MSKIASRHSLTLKSTDGLSHDGTMLCWPLTSRPKSESPSAGYCIKHYPKTNRYFFRLGGHIDLTIGPHWPTGFPGYTPDCPETMKELVHGQLIVNSGQTFTGLLPLPKEAPSGNETGNIVTATPRLVTVVTARTNATDNSSAEVIGFDPKTVSVLSEIIPDEANQTVTWTAPDDGNYILVAAYCRGTGQIQNMYDGKHMCLIRSVDMFCITDYCSES